jgi:dihydroorotate dehydrogenase electron transfer subunit
MKIHRARIQYVHKIHEEAFRIGLSAGGISREAVPGQFYMVRVGTALDPLLSRPFAMHRTLLREGGACGEGDGIEFLCQIVGKGTRLLSEKRPGDWIDVLGPLGKGWEPRAGRTPVLVGGGIGVASLLPLAERLAQAQRQALLFLGARSPERLWCTEELERYGVLHTAVEEGDHPFLGTVLDLLKSKWDAVSCLSPQLFVCGPPMMVKKLAQWATDRKVPCQVSLEASMACGVGVCLGCAVKGHEGAAYFNVCKEGPVFEATLIDWEAFHVG